MNRQLKNKELAADEDDYNNIDFYLPKLDGKMFFSHFYKTYRNNKVNSNLNILLS